MMKKLRRLLALVLTVAMILSITACGNGKEAETNTASTGSSSNADASAPAKDTLVVVTRSEATNLDPHNNTSLSSFMVERAIYDRLVDKDENGFIVPCAATEWEIVDDTTIRFHLRDDIYFHNGEKLTAEDVKYSIARAEKEAGSRTFFKFFDGANTEVIDDTTIDIKVYEPFAPVFNYLSSARGSIVCASAMESMGSDAYGRNPIGSGPLKFTEWVAGDHIELARNDDYWGDKVAYKDLIFRVIGEDASRAIELESGGADISLYIAQQDISSLESNPETEVISVPSYATVSVAFNSVKFDYLQDVRVRKALAMALDREGIVEAVYHGSATVADSVYSSVIPYHTSNEIVSYDPEAAKALLEEAGFDFSQPIKLVTMGSASAVAISEIVQNMWESIGLSVETSILDWAVFSQTMADPGLPVIILDSNASSGDPDHGFYNWTWTEAGVHNDPLITELLEKGKQTYKDDDRAKIYAELQEVCIDYYGLVPIAFTDSTFGIRSNVKGFIPDSGNVLDLTKIHFE
ncbi:ABC transporter substrate-binding protein [Fusibacter paucivorans]|uniref:ABC transporter substrate-binding protein n=1 Tax=Fusibacter paucivorans TaxID=76009 RepID=A0ABS5PTF0_9FIRM|nr:ABC transporter substrate-binding protein [Fusibacter paucivorans]MBS7527659.1 ABC transporter substrate-binding protein [Fusibacter paucivorans]